MNTRSFEEHAFSRGNVVAVTWWQLWDEWKWKVGSLFENVDYVAVSVWWANAWHTVKYNWESLVFHELPWWAIIPDAQVYCWQWRVINLAWLQSEIWELERVWLPTKWKVIVAGNAQVILENLQKKLDWHIEELKWRGSVWTTKKWIWPAYWLKALRTWLTVNSLLRAQDDEIKELVEINARLFNCLDEKEILKEIEQEQIRLIRMIDQWLLKIDDSNMLLAFEYEKLKRIVVEVSQSVLLAKDGWMYPYCTSSDTTVNWICSALNIPKVHYHIMVMKAIKSKVWWWFFPTKFPAEIADPYRKLANEYGATTWRPRDVWWFDAVEARCVLLRQAVDAICLTKVDMLDKIPELKVWERYWNWQRYWDCTLPTKWDYDGLRVEYWRPFSLEWDIFWLTDRSKLPWSYEEYLKYLIETLHFNGDVLVWTWPNPEQYFEF